jgi:transcriptional regulator with XRE-family HTH domain
MFDLSKFGQRLKSERKKYGMSQTELSDLTDIPQPYISEYENKGRMPTVINLIVLSEQLCCPIGYLLGGERYD